MIPLVNVLPIGALCLFQGLQACLFPRETHGLCMPRWPEARHVHRLDQDTSGLVVMALTVEAAREMCRQFRERGEISGCLGSGKGLFIRGIGVAVAWRVPLNTQGDVLSCGEGLVEKSISEWRCHGCPPIKVLHRVRHV